MTFVGRCAAILSVLALLGCPDKDPILCFEDTGNSCTCRKNDTSGTGANHCSTGLAVKRRCYVTAGFPDQAGSLCYCRPPCCLVNTGNLGCACQAASCADSDAMEWCDFWGENRCKVIAPDGSQTCYAVSRVGCQPGEQSVSTCGADDVMPPQATQVSACPPPK
jgi:hypothetical protein